MNKNHEYPVGTKSTDIVGSLTMSCMKHNYIEFVAEWGYDKANDAMANLFGSTWSKAKEQIWQWYDTEYTREVSNAS